MKKNEVFDKHEVVYHKDTGKKRIIRGNNGTAYTIEVLDENDNIEDTFSMFIDHANRLYVRG